MAAGTYATTDGEKPMTKIDDAMVERAHRTYWGVGAPYGEGNPALMLQALEAALNPPEIVVTEEMLRAGCTAILNMESTGIQPPSKLYTTKYADIATAAYRAMRKLEPVGTQSATYQDTVAVGVVPDRTDGLLSLHVGGSVVFLTPTEALGVATFLKIHAGKDRRKGDAT